MNFKKGKTTVMAVTLITGIVASLSAKAIQMSGTLGASLVAVDAYSFTCASGTVQARVRIFDMNGILNLASTVYSTFGEDGSPTLTVFDTESTGTSSPWATNTADGPGNYALVVRKSAANSEDYVVEAQCLNTIGQVNGPVRLIFQINQ